MREIARGDHFAVHRIGLGVESIERVPVSIAVNVRLKIREAMRHIITSLIHS